MPDYQKSKIYQIISPSHPEVPPYYGSTTQTLSSRMSGHRAHYRRDTRESNSELILCYEDAIIVLVENYPCANKSELENREAEIIKANKCCNKQIPSGKLINYQNGKIYKIYSPSHPEIDPYYGSTIQSLHMRFSGHKYKKNCTSNLIICYEDALIELVEEVKCNNVEELLAREVWWITNNPCINKNNPVKAEGADKEYGKKYREANKEALDKRGKEYYKKNKEAFDKRGKEYYKKNKEALKEYKKEYGKKYREAYKEYHKKYREANKEALKEYKKEYYKKNKEARKEYKKEYREANKEYYKEYNKKYREMQKKLKSTT